MSDVSLVIGYVDQPTDGVLDYSERLAFALRSRGVTVDISSRRPDGAWDPQPPWRAQRGTCVVQYTALAWSKRGFPVRLLPVLWRIKRARRTLVVVLHDPSAFPGSGVVGTVRRRVQLAVMRRALRWSTTTVVTVEPELIGWLAGVSDVDRRKVVHIPVGSNIPAGAGPGTDPHPFTVSVFGVTERSEPEARWIGRAIAEVAREVEVRLQVFGRGALDAEATLSAELGGTSAQLKCEGVLPPDRVADRLAETDALLFVRGAASRRGSMVAAITAGVPVVATRGPETGPLEMSGVILVDREDPRGAAAALTRLARDPGLREEMRERNRVVTQEAFSWDAIADRFVGVLP